MTSEQLDRVIEMAWEDRTPFEAIEYQFGLMEKDVISLMRQTLKPGSFRSWRKRVSGRKTKHAANIDRHVKNSESRISAIVMICI